MEDLERIQLNARRLISGDLNVYFSLFALFFTLIFTKLQFLSIIIFTLLSIYAVGRNYLRVIEIPFYFIFPSILIILFTIDGKTIFEFWILKISDKAIETAFSTLLRVFATLSILFYLISTTTLPEFVSTLKRLKFPQFLVELMFLSYRTIQVLYGEAKKFEISAKIRLGYSGFRNSVSTTSLLARMIFLRAMDRIEKTVFATDLRGEEIPELECENKGFLLSFLIFLLMVIVLCLK
ncbi:MAG: CbiQ family ECF transporter T component [Archaeoglobaceae archaeon]|nr:CbiQ family ECF transporter T component [Archaeoglobaceae archaeon]